MELMVVSSERITRPDVKIKAPPIKDKRPELLWVQMHMEEPCFHFLRTKETLGWVASAPSGGSAHPGGSQGVLPPQVPGVPQLQEHLRAPGLLRHRGNAGHQVQVALMSL